MAEQPNSTSQVEPQNVTPQAQPEPVAFDPIVQGIAQAAEIARSEPQPVVEEPQAPSVPPEWVQAAKDVYFTDDEIAGFQSPAMLQDAVVGRRTRLQYQFTPQQPVQNQPVTPAPQKADLPPLPELKLEIAEGEVADEVAKPIKQVAEYSKQMAAYISAREKAHAEEKAALQEQFVQYQQAVQQAAMAQQAQQADEVVKSIPGAVEFFGDVPSKAIAQPGTRAYAMYQSVAELSRSIAARHAAIVGPHNVDPRKVFEEAFRVLNPDASPVSTGANGRNGNNAARPGQGIRSSARSTGMRPALDSDPVVSDLLNSQRDLLGISGPP